MNFRQSRIPRRRRSAAARTQYGFIRPGGVYSNYYIKRLKTGDVCAIMFKQATLLPVG
jgi:hypothetical protein